MRDMLAEGSAWLAGQFKQFAASRVSYTRGAASTRLPASHSRMAPQVDDGNGFFTRVEVWVWHIHVDDLEIDNVPTLPEVGDQIKVGPSGAEEIYEVMELPGESCWRWSDSHRNQYRIHTKLVTRAQ